MDPMQSLLAKCRDDSVSDEERAKHIYQYAASALAQEGKAMFDAEMARRQAAAQHGAQVAQQRAEYEARNPQYAAMRTHAERAHAGQMEMGGHGGPPPMQPAPPAHPAGMGFEGGLMQDDFPAFPGPPTETAGVPTAGMGMPPPSGPPMSQTMIPSGAEMGGGMPSMPSAMAAMPAMPMPAAPSAPEGHGEIPNMQAYMGMGAPPTPSVHGGQPGHHAARHAAANHSAASMTQLGFNQQPPGRRSKGGGGYDSMMGGPGGPGPAPPGPAGGPGGQGNGHFSTSSENTNEGVPIF